MNLSQIHLVLNHVPVVGAFILSLLFIHYQMWHIEYGKKNIFRAYVAVFIIIIPVYFTGTPARDLLQNYAGISNSLIDLHRNYATASSLLIMLTGLLSLYALNLLRKNITVPRWFNIIFILITVALLTVISLTAEYGGRIRHPEII